MDNLIKHTAKVALITASLGLAQLAHAAWEVTPEVTLEAGVDDNFRLDPVNEEEATVASVEVAANILNVTEVSSFRTIIGARYTDYFGVDDQFEVDGQDSQFILLRGLRQGERWNAGLLGNIRRESLLRSAQTDVVNLDGDDGFVVDLDPADAEAGLVEEEIDRTRVFLRPYVTYLLSQRASLTGGINYSSLSHDNDDALPLNDTQEIGAYAEYKYQVSERDTVGVHVARSKFDPDNLEASDLSEATFLWERRLSENTRFNVEVGARRAEPDNGDSETGALVRAGFQSRSETGVFDLRVERRNAPSAFGDVVEFDRVRMRWRTDLSERWKSETQLRATRTSRQGDASDANDRDNAEFRQKFAYALSEAWEFGVTYQYRYIDRESQVDSADSNAIYLNLTFRPLSEF